MGGGGGKREREREREREERREGERERERGCIKLCVEVDNFNFASLHITLSKQLVKHDII